MNNYIDKFNSRNQKTKDFINLLIEMEKSYEIKAISGENLIKDDIEFIQALRSTALLMLYNLVEFTIENSIKAIYSIIADNEVKYEDLHPKIQSYWFEMKFNETFMYTSNFNTYKKKGRDLIKKIISNDNIDIIYKKTGGNFSSDEILSTLSEIEIINDTLQQKLYTMKNTNDIFKNIVDARNALAHGRNSFFENYNNISSRDIHSYLEEIDPILNEIINLVNEYIQNEEYLNTSH